jgi:type IV pilus assembly protein PilA
MTDAFSYQGAPPPSAPPPRHGMSGCAIAAIIGAVLMVLGVVVASILAAIAVPAYQDYVTKSRVVEAARVVQTLEARIDELQTQTGQCPDATAIGYGDDAVLELGGVEGVSGGDRARLTVGSLDNGHCAVELRFENINPAVDGRTIVFESTRNGWTCDGGDLAAKYRPASCAMPDSSP